jgi:hypothetical protein
VLSGPLVRWNEFMHQLDNRPFAPGWEERAVKGVVLVVIGLLQKVFLGDALAPMVAPVFAAAVQGDVAAGDAWQGVLAFTFQIYFDFSGYSDIAIGLALLFGVRLPENFAAPYRATSVREFWRRWHMTLSRFLRDYLYDVALEIAERGRDRVAELGIADRVAGLVCGRILDERGEMRPDPVDQVLAADRAGTEILGVGLERDRGRRTRRQCHDEIGVCLADVGHGSYL